MTLKECFNPRARAGRDAPHVPSVARILCFNPRARAGRDRALRCRMTTRTEFQSTPRAGRDNWQCTMVQEIRPVSIHAPARARRKLLSPDNTRVAVSIHRARAGRDRGTWGNRRCCGCFNPTRPRGARHAAALARHPCFVSIHAPARGATHYLQLGLIGTRSFNPRARAGRDLSLSFICAIFARFQSTRPRGARHHSCMICDSTDCFNPRARAGRDHRLC